MGKLPIAALVLCAGALVVEGKKVKAHPPYQDYLVDYKNAVDKMTELTPPNNATAESLSYDNKNRHYGVLVGVLLDVTSVLSTVRPGPQYEFDTYYPQSVSKKLSYSWDNPGFVGESLRSLLQLMKQQNAPVEQLLKDCLNSANNKDCDAYVDEKVQQNKDLQDKAKTFVATGELSRVYLKNTYEKEAEKYEVVKLLVEGKDKLADLVKKAVTVYQSLHLVYAED